MYDLSRALHGQWTVVFTLPGPFPDVIACAFDEYPQELAALRMGERVTVTGEVVGQEGTHEAIRLQHCRAVPAK
jgi:hypothetical protein